MSIENPVQSPKSESALRTYLRAIALVSPSLLVWNFGNLFLLPKVQQIWELAGLPLAKVQWIMNGSYALMNHGQLLFLITVLTFALLEGFTTFWPPYRRSVVAFATVFFQAVVLFAITSISVAVVIAAPLLTRKQ